MLDTCLPLLWGAPLGNQSVYQKLDLAKAHLNSKELRTKCFYLRIEWRSGLVKAILGHNKPIRPTGKHSKAKCFTYLENQKNILALAYVFSLLT